MRKLTRDDTEHGKLYYLADEVDALLAQADDVPAEILERDASRRELPAYLRSVPGVVDLINLKVRS